MNRIICEICGLPKEICVCAALDQETLRIVIATELRRYGKPSTVISGINNRDIKVVATILKRHLACGGTVKNKQIVLMGNHKRDVKEWLLSQGYTRESVELR